RFAGLKTAWGDWSFQLYVQLKPGIDFETANAALRELYTRYGPSDFIEGNRGTDLHPFAYPMDKWHLYSEFDAQGRPTEGRITSVWPLLASGIVVLLVACINFINLSTARTEKRSKEVGIRRTVGSNNRQFVGQLISRSLLISCLATISAFLLVL